MVSTSSASWKHNPPVNGHGPSVNGYESPVNGHVEPQYGSRLLPQVVDQLSYDDPKRVYASFPLSSDLSQGFRDVTMLEVSQAVNGFAYWLEEHFGRSTNFETISYMGVSDLRYVVVFLAVVKCGYKLLVPSVRNSTWMNLSLLEQTKCSKFLYSLEMTQKVHDLRSKKEGLQMITVPSLDDMIQGGSKHYPYEAVFEDVRWDPVLIVHSSGSTGPPKPVITNHGTYAIVDNDRKLPIVKGRKNQSWALFDFEGSGGRYFTAVPPFHTGGFLTTVVVPIYSTTATVVLAPPDRPPTGQLVAQIMQHYRLRAIVGVPTTFDQLVQESEGLEMAKQLDFILYSGGPMTTTTGNILSKVTDICQYYGTTETGLVPARVPLREDWAYSEFHPIFGVDMQPYGDDTYEFVLHKDPKLQGVRGLSNNFPEVEHWHTRDLFQPHPTKPNLWRFYGRTDDITVLSNGEKFNPVPSEIIISGHHPLSGALLVGQGRFQAALLVEVDEHAAPTENLIEDLWPTVERANAQAPGHARITRSMIAVAEPGKRFERAGKGTIIRKTTEKKFAAEIEALYSKETPTIAGPVLGSMHNMEAIRNYVRASINLSYARPDLKDDSDLYVLGLDSLKSAEIVNTLKAGLGGPDTSWLSIQTVYANPTVRKLSDAMYRSLNPHETIADEGSSSNLSRITKMADLVHMYTQDLPSRSPKLTVALNGSTGSLGSHILRSLLDDPTISKVYCLNRSSNAQESQSKSFVALSHSHNLDTPRVQFIHAHYGDSKLGLPDPLYEELTSTVDIIIYNAWKVDFNHTISSFEPVHIRGIRNLIDWNLSSSRNPRIMFISSISSAGNWNPAHGPVPEEHISDHEVAQAMGYAESKHVSECMLHVASEKSGVPVSILRVGQIGGPVTSTGVWNKHEWFPSMIQTSQSLGYLPDYIPDIEWIPVDILASTIRDIIHFTPTTEEKAQVYNLVNPTSTPWHSLISTVLSHLKTPPQIQLIELSKWIATLDPVNEANIQELTTKLDAVLSNLKNPQRHVQVIELSKWIGMLEKVNQNDVQELSAKPAVKILDFFCACEKVRKEGQEGKLKYRTSRGLAVSKTMRELMPVGEEWMGIWLDRLGY